MEYLNYSSVPFEMFLALFTGVFVTIALGGVILRWVLHRPKLGGYLLAGAIGSFIGFVIATAPYILMTAQKYIMRLASGYWYEEWPPSMWPTWLPLFGPFDGFVIGSILGFVIGCYVFGKRNKKVSGKGESPC
jgi:hypothetical protein